MKLLLLATILLSLPASSFACSGYKPSSQEDADHHPEGGACNVDDEQFEGPNVVMHDGVSSGGGDPKASYDPRRENAGN
jgi:hypothetical protein